MNRADYMKSLEHGLKRLPKEDYDRAISYFEEYFEEAGPDNEKQAIEDLGSPALAADQIIRDFAVENAEKPTKNVKRSFSAVWVGILAVFAAPVGLPLAFAAAALGLAFILVIVSLIFAVFCTALAFAASSVPAVMAGIWFLFTSPASGIATIGAGLIGAGIGIWVIIGCITLCRWFLNTMTKLFGRIAKGGNRHEK
ncbi:DUF1700 domain-containing protein [[Clostridium] hylemonae]|uniref:DUF1700 domain-containing protein n=1 Tax=[Clostridium] hylemonae TaxID=89153 RepID=UPI001D076A3B|nr:DUF1700 domain-containing protein [[Clostridium] hylemonae]MCB7520233.1 DUF1700 domain-containing protein [[Clostridium] hylemonae]BDF05843.1 hypothetical protein CE91St63_29050 [[Clostridium] hylemonae]